MVCTRMFDGIISLFGEQLVRVRVVQEQVGQRDAVDLLQLQLDARKRQQRLAEERREQRLHVHAAVCARAAQIRQTLVEVQLACTHTAHSRHNRAQWQQ